MNSRFDIFDTPLHGLKLVQRKRIGDSRGYLERLFCTEGLGALLLGRNIVQINHTMADKRGAVRGLHFQYPPHAETKIVSCLKGEIFDVAVDVRRDSPTFLHWYGAILSAENGKSLFIPEGYAHGFQTLTEACELIYLHTAAYNFKAEGALNVADPRLNVAWPLPIDGLSERDRTHPFISSDFPGIAL
jgi:dTDP-4-dehydrorhamnose 3,5-epimerase